MMPYSPFIALRCSPLQKYKPDVEYGLSGWLCEQYRQETQRGEWKLYGIVTEDGYEEQGNWGFLLDGEIRFGQPPTKVLEHFSLTPETYTLLQQSATAVNGVNYIYHYIPKKEWGKVNLWQQEMFYKQYEDVCKELHLTKHIVSNAPVFGRVNSKKSKNPIDNVSEQVIGLARTYVNLIEESERVDLFDPNYDEVQSRRTDSHNKLTLALQESRIDRSDIAQFAYNIVHWYGR